MSLLRRRALLGFLALMALPLAGRCEPAPAFDLSAVPESVKLQELKGKVIYLDFWASWCAPCRQSFPWMSEVQQRFGDQGFQVIAVNLDKERALADEFLKQNPAAFTVAYDDGTLAERYGVQVMPTSYLIDRSGQIVTRHHGFRHADTAKLEQQISQVLKGAGQ